MVDRPPTNGLAVLGGAPPTRSGGLPTAGRLSTGTAKRGQTGRTAGGTVMDPRARELIVKLRVKFGDAAATLQGQEIITQEVLHYFEVLPTRPAQTREADLSLLEDRIRARLVGGTPTQNYLASLKRAEVTDEWLAIFKYGQAIGDLKERLVAEAAKTKKLTLKEQLEAQIREHELQRRLEQQQEEAYWREEQAALRRAEEEEEARRRLQREIMVKVKQERLSQMDERAARREAALARQRAEDALDASRIAFATAEELRTEELTKVTAKQALREFLAENEVNKALREEAKKQQWVEDAAFQRKWEAMLNKQEADRKEQMDRIKRHQAKLQEAADRQGEMKRPWLPTPLVERYYKQREDDRAAEEERRLAQQKETAKRMVVAQAEQLKEREAERLRLKQREEAYAASVAAKVRAGEEAERARKLALAEQKRRLRAELDAQLRDVALRRREAAKPMNDTERSLNSQTLQQVAAWQNTGKLPAVPLPDLRASAPAAVFTQ